MADLSITDIASFRGDIEDLRNGTIKKSVFNKARNKIVKKIGEEETGKLERRLRTELTQGDDDIGDSRPDERKYSPGMESRLSKYVTFDKGSSSMAIGGKAYRGRPAQGSAEKS